MDDQSANGEFGLNHYFDQEQNTNGLTVDSGIGNRHSIWEHSTDYPMANSGFDLNHNLDYSAGNRHSIREHSTDYPMANSGFDLNHNLDYSAASNGIAGIQTRKGNRRYLDPKPIMINVLTQGKELLNQLRIHLDPSSSTGEFLIEKILSSFNKTLSILNSSVSETEIQPIGPIPSTLDSPRSINGSPQSDGSNRRDMYKKRKALPQWTEQVRVCSGTGLEGRLDDGHSWMKYGQKNIPGAKYPRGYYRCAHCVTQNCRATKQVQLSEDDPSIVELTYRGKHTCIPPSVTSVLQPPENSPTLDLNFSYPIELDKNFPFDSLSMFD